MTYSAKVLNEIDDGHLKAAYQLLDKAVEYDDDETLFNLAGELAALGLTDKASDIYQRLLKKYPDEDQLKTSLAELAIDDGQNDRALQYLSQVSPQSPAYLQSLLVAADLYQTEGEFEVCESKLMEAYQLEPDEPAVFFACAEYYYLVGNFERAIPFYFALIKTGTTSFSNVDLAGRLAMCYAQRGHYEQALGYFQQVAPAAMTSDLRFQTGLTQLHLKHYSQAEDTLKQLIDDDPQYTSAYQQLANVYQQEHKLDLAFKTLQEGIGMDEYNEQLYVQAGQLAEQLGDGDKAAEYLAHAHQLDPENITVTLAYSRYLLQNNQYEKNLALLQPLANDDDVDPQVEWNIGRSYLGLEQLKKAGSYFQAAAPLLNDDSQFLHDYAQWARAAGELTTLKSILRQYLKLEPTDTEMAALYDELQ
ncbi:MAG TPA: tetratricopeptide repeat protein [Candidatus Limosilactobacillus merdipullorum]|uniref:Tetratricopeptide repeat protein n=1 Tax=Candidatus Limosilactobacillus merdipullorum TaxID=2838653 RepID=A0A9D1QRC3_9LACO|nr:tetratricopeptide repeat protein [Candidatus Limosilactobacillus merdipullorum]